MHGESWPLRLGTAGALLIPAVIFVGAWLVATGAVLLIAASVWNVIARRRCEVRSRTGVPTAQGSPL